MWKSSVTYAFLRNQHPKISQERILRGGHSRGYPIDLLIDFLYGTVLLQFYRVCGIVIFVVLTNEKTSVLRGKQCEYVKKIINKIFWQLTSPDPCNLKKNKKSPRYWNFKNGS
jgi:hypothetical protein